MKSIYGLFGSGAHVSEQEALDLGTAMASHVEEAIAERRPRGILRASNLGTKCERKLWYTVNTPEKAEPVEPHAQNKFLYGHLIEEYILWMLKKAGHKVEKRQETVRRILFADACSQDGALQGHHIPRFLRSGVPPSIPIEPIWLCDNHSAGNCYFC